MNRVQTYATAGIAIALVAIGVWQFSPRAAVSPSVTNQLPPAPAETGSATSSQTGATPPATGSSPVSHPLPLAKGDTVASWSFKGAYTGNPELTAKAQGEIARLSGLLATATSSKMILSVGIANQYELLGAGAQQYDYLGRAVRADAVNGLPWHNLGVLMERLGALETARIAYEKSTLLQPELKFYQYAYLDFLITRMKGDTASIERAFAAAEKSIGQTPYLLELRTEWTRP